MISSLRLFGVLPIKNSGLPKKSDRLLSKTINKGFIFSDEVIANYSEDHLLKMASEISPDSFELNNAFHKSWEKVRSSDLETLYKEQIFHYLTTYGDLGGGDVIYIPNERLDVPKIDIDKISLRIIKGISKDELKLKVKKMLSGIALNKDTIKDIVDIILYLGFSDEEILEIKNNEVRCLMYEYMNIIPKDEVEFLRYIIFKSTGETQIIKSDDLIDKIKASDNILASRLISQYDLNKLSKIFYRFKPLFLAFRTNSTLKRHINKIRRLAVKNHEPLKKSYLDKVTENISLGKLDIDKLKKTLKRASVFRKIKLAYALNFRKNNPKSVLYKIRNGKSYCKDMGWHGDVSLALEKVLESIYNDMNVSGKRIFIPENVCYALPSSEKQFTGNFPSGSYISVKDSMVFGINWKNIDNTSVDLDLSLINSDGDKIGWDGSHRNEDVLFSGDMTDASNGAAELFNIKNGSHSGILYCNFYNYARHEKDCKFDIIVAKDEPENLTKNYVVDPNKIIAKANSSIGKHQKILGLLISNNGNIRFYFAESSFTRSITSSSEFSSNLRSYFMDYYSNSIRLNELLVSAGAIISNKDDCDIDLSPECVSRDTILNLFK